jgi:hypothetical protein
MKPMPILSVHGLVPLPVDHDRQRHIRGLLSFIKRYQLRGEKTQFALWQWIYSEPHREEWRVDLFTRMLRRLKRSQERQGVSEPSSPDLHPGLQHGRGMEPAVYAQGSPGGIT